MSKVKTIRIHAFDNLRAAMMLLGIIIHSALTYGIHTYDEEWPIKDPHSTHYFFDFLALFIHSFRMQVFFLISGFFGAMLYKKYGVKKMLINRLYRIVFPFIVFVTILWPLVSLNFMHTYFIFEGTSLIKTNNETGFDLYNLIPKKTYHLWFLYYLILFTLFTTSVALVLNRYKVLKDKIIRLFHCTIRNPLSRLLIIPFFIGIVYLLNGSTHIKTSISFIPEINTFSYFICFYLLGWFLYVSESNLDLLFKHNRLFVLFGLLLYSCSYIFSTTGQSLLDIVLKTIQVSFLVFGFLGLFLKYANTESKIMSYLSKASYWIYLIHLPITIYIPSLLVNWNVPAILKFTTVVALTFTISLLSYEYLVRKKLIGRFLNG